MLDLIYEIRQTLSRNKTRTFLTGLAVAWGIFMLIILLGMSHGVQNNFREFAEDPKSRTLQLWGGYTSKPYKGYREWRMIQLENTDKKALMQRNGDVITDVTSTINFGEYPVYSDEDYLTSGPLAANVTDIINITKVPYGRHFNERDMAEKRKVMMIERRNAEILFGDASKALGKTLRCMGLAWTVVGVYEHEWDNNTYIPFETGLALKGNDPSVNELKIYLKELSTTEQAEEAEKSIRQTMGAVHEFDPEDTGAMWSWNRLSNTLSGRAMLDIVNIAVWIIGLMTLVSGIVGVSNIMFVSVKERTHEIGVRRAIGARPSDIVKQIIFEGIAITALFGYIGVVGGIATTELLNHLFGDGMGIKDATVNVSLALEVTLVLIVCGALAALFPALKATKIKPVEALRDE